MAARHLGDGCPTCRRLGDMPQPACLGCDPNCGPGCGPLPTNYRAPEEFVCNGGDLPPEVVVRRDWTVRGLQPGDTVVHYDTIDGRTKVVPTNEVCLYAPRFAAVRKVFAPVVNEQHDRPAGVEFPLAISQSSDIGEPTTVVQPLQPGRQHIVTAPQKFRERTRGIGVDNSLVPMTAQDQFLPFENLTLIRRGAYDTAEQPVLAERLASAIVWTHNQAPQVLIDSQPAVQLVGNLPLQSIYTYELPPGKSRLQVVKIASRGDAKPGDTVDFTIRFDNVGDQTIGNVTIVDRLHDRLEYVADSQSSTLPANFFTEQEDGSVRVLRWELTQPLDVREGGILRFRARVR
ncbi:MAG: hypothetical protein AB7F89_05095 [Pirellulaceae bacterium]